MGCQQGFIQEIRERGFRFTPQREMVLQVLHDLRGHHTAEEIYARVQQISTSVDISTVYRTLDLLQELGMVCTLDLNDGQRRYELLTAHGPHHHLLCRSCQTVVRLEQEEFAALFAQLEEGFGFVAQLEHCVIPGLCAACRTAEAHPPGESPVLPTPAERVV